MDYDCEVYVNGITIRNAHCPDKSCGSRNLKVLGRESDFIYKICKDLKKNLLCRWWIMEDSPGLHFSSRS